MDLGTDDFVARTERPYFKGIFTILSPALIAYTYHSFRKLNYRAFLSYQTWYKIYDSAPWLRKVLEYDTFKTFCVLYLIFGVAGYAGYVASPEGVLGRFYRTFVKEDAVVQEEPVETNPNQIHDQDAEEGGVKLSGENSV